MSSLSLRDYGLIGNQCSVALVSHLGSVDWFCLPHLDSASHFGALVDQNQGGSFQIAPLGEFHSSQRYISRTNVLQTIFETPNGKGVLTDWMPMPSSDEQERDPILHRMVETLAGEIDWVMLCTPRFDYGVGAARAERHRDDILFRGPAQSDLALLRASLPIEITKDGISARTQLKLKEKSPPARFTWIWGRRGRFRDFPSPDETIQTWKNWSHAKDAHACIFAGPWHDLVTRSGLVIKLMTQPFSGSIAESATTSLPLLSGGSRNWDHRFAWIRDCAFTYQALIQLRLENEAEAYFSWISDLVVRDGAEELQSVYVQDGGRFLPERELTYLQGYGGSRPVRVGNHSARQFHLDVYGHVMLAASYYFRIHKRLPAGLWPRLKEITDYVCQAWRRPDRGRWEIRSKPEHFVISKVMCWVALDQAIRLSKSLGEPAPPRWKEEQTILHRTTCEQGYDAGRGSFVRAFGDRDLDASSLLIPIVGFLPWDDPRTQGTITAIQGDLSDGALLHRNSYSEQMPESDGAHLLASFWLVSCLALSGNQTEAQNRLAEICSYATPLGLFAEQVAAGTGDPAGNLPSASAHLALINASLYVGASHGRIAPAYPLIGDKGATSTEKFKSNDRNRAA